MERWPWVVVCVLVTQTVRAQTVIRVDAGAFPGGDGSTWSTAMNELRPALLLAASMAPAQVWVARGTYRPDGDGGDRDLSFPIAAGVQVFGGFAGTEASLAERDPISHPVVLSGDINLPEIESDNARHVVVFTATSDATSLLDGVTVEGGNADGATFPSDSGGGILIDGGSPRIRGCVVRRSMAKYGGGIFSRPGSPVIEETRIERNIASADGGGVNANGSVVLRRCTLDANRAAFGGGIVVCCGTSRIEDSTLTGNFAATGGGIFSPIGTLWVIRCRLEANTGGNGGGLNSSSSSSTLNVVSTVFAGNAATQGGGLYATNAPIIFNCIFSKNTSMQRGAGMYLQGSARIINCTVHSNWSLTQGGGMYAASGVPMLANTILWGNADTQATLQAGQLSSATGSWTINYCNVQGWTGSIPGVGNSAAAPIFANAPGPDLRLGTMDDEFRLLPGSWAIDAGDGLLLPIDTWDLDGDGNTAERAPLDIADVPRVVDDPGSVNQGPGSAPHVDIGAYERQATCRADYDGSGFVDIEDYSTFIATFELGTPAADFDSSGFVDMEDFTAFVLAFELGC